MELFPKFFNKSSQLRKVRRLAFESTDSSVKKVSPHPFKLADVGFVGSSLLVAKNSVANTDIEHKSCYGPIANQTCNFHCRAPEKLGFVGA